MSRQEVYTPGNILHVRYSNTYDLVLDYTENTGNWMSWAVTVIQCDRNGKPLEEAGKRVHCTSHLGKTVVGNIKSE